MAAHSRRSLQRARQKALAELVDTTHWLTFPAAAALIPMTPGNLRDWLKRNPGPPCLRCPVYRRIMGHWRRAFSPEDVRALRAAILRRRYPLHAGRQTNAPAKGTGASPCS